MLHNPLESCEGSQRAGLIGALSAFFVCSPQRQACELSFSSAPSTQLYALEFMLFFYLRERIFLWYATPRHLGDPELHSQR